MKAPAFDKDAPYGTIHPVESGLAYEQNGWFYDTQRKPLRKSDTPPPPAPVAVAVAEPEEMSIDDLPDESSDDVPEAGVNPVKDVDKSLLASWFGGNKVPFFTVRSAIKRALDVHVTGADEARRVLSEKYGW
jgi:hypothetical protein